MNEHDATEHDATEHAATEHAADPERVTPHERELSGGQVPAGSELNRWVATVADELGVHPDAVDVDLLLDLARDVAHGVARPAVPLTSFMVGYAVGAGSADRVELERVVARAAALARGWDSGDRTPEGSA